MAELRQGEVWRFFLPSLASADAVTKELSFVWRARTATNICLVCTCVCALMRAALHVGEVGCVGCVLVQCIRHVYVVYIYIYIYINLSLYLYMCLYGHTLCICRIYVQGRELCPSTKIRLAPAFL